MSAGSATQHEPDPADRRIIEIAAGFLLAAVSLAMLFWIIPAHVGQTQNEHDISPDFFPTAAAWTLLGLSLALIVDRILKTTDLRKSIAFSSGGLSIIIQQITWLIVAALAYSGMAYVNFHITAVALIVTGALVCHYRKWHILAAVAIIAPVLVGQISWWVFGVKFT